MSCWAHSRLEVLDSVRLKGRTRSSVGPLPGSPWSYSYSRWVHGLPHSLAWENNINNIWTPLPCIAFS